MLHREAPRHPRAAVVADDRKALEAERAHHLDLILRHRALRVVRVVLAVRRLAAVAVAAQIGHHHGKALGEARRNLVPLDMRLRVAVDEEQRRA